MICALDLETKRIGPGAIAPEIICCSTAYSSGDIGFIGNNDKETLRARLHDVLKNADLIVGAHIAYDMGCIWNQFPQLSDLIFQAYQEGRIQDIQLNEKLHVLGTTGNLEFLELPDGTNTKISFSLAALEQKYLGLDRRESKTGGEDIWRTNYEVLDGVPAEKYPEEALEYALDDAVNTLKIYQLQQLAPLENQQTAAFQARSAFALFLMTITGWAVDPEEVKRLDAWLTEELDDAKHELLFETGILRPSEPPRLKKRGEGMTKGKPASKNMQVLREYIAELSEEYGLELQYTDPSDRYPEGQISTSKGVVDELAKHDSVFEQFSHRERLIKLRTTYLPQFYDEDGNLVPRIHASYDPLKRTGRTSSFASKLFPSTNIQQMDPRVRGCYVPDPGYILVSCDYSALELCSAAWRMKDLFGESKLWDLIKAGKDPHVDTGAMLAEILDPDFRESCEGLTEEETYELFSKLKKVDPEFFGHYRTFAKPTGLGYLGGLGLETFVEYAKTVYGIDVAAEAAKLGMTATELASLIREKWLDKFPDIKKYLREYIEANWKYVNHYGEEVYAYTSPLGMTRAGASYTAAANGGAMQTPAGEGAKLAVWDVQVACWYDKESPLYGRGIPLAFIHDELIIQVPDDETTEETTQELSRIMVASMEHVLQGVPIKAEPCLMRRWDKKAKPVFSDTGELVPYV